jgi:hypothetical protein
MASQEMLVIGTKVQMENEYKPGKVYFSEPGIRVVHPHEILNFIDQGLYIRKIAIDPTYYPNPKRVLHGTIFPSTYSWLDVKVLKEIATRTTQKGKELYIQTNSDRLIRLVAAYGNLEAMKYLVEEVGLSCSLSASQGKNVKYGTLKRAIYYKQSEMILYLWNKMSQQEREECTKTFLEGKTPTTVAMEGSFELKDRVHHGPLPLEEYDPSFICNDTPDIFCVEKSCYNCRWEFNKTKCIYIHDKSCRNYEPNPQRDSKKIIKIMNPNPADLNFMVPEDILIEFSGKMFRKWEIHDINLHPGDFCIIKNVFPKVPDAGYIYEAPYSPVTMLDCFKNL